MHKYPDCAHFLLVGRQSERLGRRLVNISIVEEKCIEEAAADDKLHHPTQSNPPDHQEKDGIVMLL